MALNDESPLRIRLITALIIVGTFVAGAVSGAAVCRWMTPRAGPPPPMHLPLRELDLTPEQEARAREITDRHRDELESILRGTYPKVRAVNDAIEAELRTVLTPEQQKKLDDLKSRRPPPRGPGGPGGGRPPPPPPPPGEPD
jgi:Spy/CpxP family protein refolding chaperone